MSRASSSPDELDAAHPRANAHRASVMSTSSPDESSVLNTSPAQRGRTDRDEGAGLMRPPALPRHIQQARKDERMSKRRRYDQTRRAEQDGHDEWGPASREAASTSRVPMGPPPLPSPPPRPSPIPLESPAIKTEYSTPAAASGILSPDAPPTNRRLDFLRNRHRTGLTEASLSRLPVTRPALSESVGLEGEEDEGEGGSGDLQDGEETPLLVFQCDACGVVLGDSFSWVAAQRDLGLLVLSTATDEVMVDQAFVTSTEAGLDVGSTYSAFNCSCGAALGRMYRTTPRALDDLRDAYCFQVTQVRVYQLGTAQANAAPRRHQPKDLEMDTEQAGAGAFTAQQRTALASTHGEHLGPNEVFDTVEKGANGKYVTPAVTARGGVSASAGAAPVQRAPSGTPAAAGRDDQRIRVLLMGIGERLVKLERQMEIMQQSSLGSNATRSQQATSAARAKTGIARSHSTSDGEGSVMSENVDNGAL